MKNFNINSLTPKEIKDARKKAENISFMKDYSHSIDFEVENINKIELVELMEKAPIKLILKKYIFKFLEKNYELIKTLRILTREEDKILDEFHENHEFTLKYLEFLIKRYREKIRDEIAEDNKKKEEEEDGNVN